MLNVASLFHWIRTFKQLSHLDVSLTVLLWLQSGAPALGYVTEQTFSPPHFHGTNGCNNTICPPEEEQGSARNLLRIIL